MRRDEGRDLARVHEQVFGQQGAQLREAEGREPVRAGPRAGERWAGLVEEEVRGGEGDWAGAFVGPEPSEGEVVESAGEEVEVGVQELEVVGGGAGGYGDAIHVDGEGADLLPASGGVGACAKAGGRVEVLGCAWVHGEEGEGAKRGERAALDGDAEGDQRVVYDTAAIALRGFLTRAGDLEVCEVWDRGECGDERGDVRGGVEERRVLFHQQISHFPAAVRRAAETSR